MITNGGSGHKSYGALVNGIVAQMTGRCVVVRDRLQLVRLKVESAQINPFGRLEVTVSTPWTRSSEKGA
jgi:hypothetical protein